MSLIYLDSSALVKLVLAEPESESLHRYLSGADLISSELALTEVPRAVRRAAAYDRTLPVERLLDQAAEVLDTLALLPLDRALLSAAGAIDEPALRTLDAIHVASAADADVDAFVSYDERQSAAARLVALRTYAPRP